MKNTKNNKMTKVEFLTTMAVHDKKRAVNDMNDFLERKIKNAESLVRTLKGYKERINIIVASETENHEEAINYFEWSVNEIENFSRNINYNNTIKIANTFGGANQTFNIIKEGFVVDGEMS